jgi:hypothetical protein
VIDPFFFVCLFAAVPVLVTTLPPMVDLPQHAAQIALLQDILSGSTPFASLFEVQLFTPYWFGYSLLFVLAKPFGVALAAKTLVVLTTVAFVACAARFTARAGAPSFWRWLFVPLPFGFAYEWGFLNFLVAVPLGFAFLAELDLRPGPRSRREILVLVAWAHALFFAHVLVMAYFLAVAALRLHVPNVRAWLRRVAPLAGVAPVVALWVVGKRAAAGEVRVPPAWAWGWGRLEALPSTLFSLPLGDAYYAIALVLVVLPVLAGYRVRRSVAALGPFALHLAVMLFAPRIAFGTSFVYQRFGYVGLPLLALAFEEDPCARRGAMARRLLSPVYALVAAALLSFHVRRALAYEAESAPFREVIAMAKPGKRMLGLPFLRGGVGYQAPTYVHYATWYSSLRGGLAEFSFATFFPQVVRYRAGLRPLATDVVNWSPELFRWSAWKGEGYTYFLVRQAHDPQAELFPAGAVRLVGARGGWWLFEVNEVTP